MNDIRFPKEMRKGSTNWLFIETETPPPLVEEVKVSRLF
jgi:hypothetical protein